MELVDPLSRLTEALFDVVDTGLPWRRVQNWVVGCLALIAIAFPVAFRAGLLDFAEARVCGIEQTLSGQLHPPSGSFHVADHAGQCELHYQPGKG